MAATARLRWAAAALRGSHGVRGGAVLFAASLVLTGAGYVFNVACIRFLGPGRYADVAAMIALSTLIALPLASVQNVVAREVAQLNTAGAIGRLLRRSTILAAVASGLLLAIGLGFVAPIERALKIESAVTVAAGLSALVFMTLATILYGFLQGTQRFTFLAATYAASGLARPVLVVPALFAGLGAAGALGVNTLASLFAVVLAAIALRDFWSAKGSEPPPSLDWRQVSVMVVAMLAFASLTNADVVLASYFLRDEEAGIYAAAALVGKFVLLVPVAATTVLLPKASSRAVRGAGSHRILFVSAAVTAALTLSLTAALALVPEDLLVWAFGPAFRESTGLLGWFGLSMTAAALVSVYLSVYLAYRDSVFPLLVVFAAVGQVVAIFIWHADARAIIFDTLTCLGAVVAIHELAFPHSLLRTWRGRRAAATPLRTREPITTPVTPP